MTTMTGDRADRIERAIGRLCGDAGTVTELFEGIAKRLEPELGHDAGAWLATDPSTILFTDGVVEGFTEGTCEPWFRHELSVPNVATFSELARSRRTTVRLSQATGGDLRASARWREVLEPAGFGNELRVVFRDGGAVWGAATIHRRTEAADFDAAEERLIARLSPVVAAGIRRIVMLERSLDTEPDGPGLLFVGPDRVAQPVTPAGTRWLELLGVPPGTRSHPALFTLGELTAGSRPGKRRVRVQTTDGRWITLYAEPMQDRADTFAVIVEPSRRADVASITALAYGLSGREQQLVLALARGDGTEAMAEQLGISLHTVRDHLKSIFEKTAVRSRSELVARLFHDHYAESFFERAVIRHG
jgi:DNA-binding CsgD family transcriptional regulator